MARKTKAASQEAAEDIEVTTPEQEQEDTDNKGTEVDVPEGDSTPEQVIEQLRADIAKRDADIVKNNEVLAEKEKERLAAVDASHKANQKLSEESTRAYRAEEEQISAHESSLEQALSSANQRVDALAFALEQAREVGDIKAEVKATKDLASASYDLRKLEDDKRGFEQFKVNREEQKKAPRQPQISAATQSWIDTHPRFTTDGEYHNAALDAEQNARRRGYAADSPAYFDYVNQKLEQQFGTASQPAAATQPPQAPRTHTPNPSSVAAPVSRDTAPGGSPNRITLTAAEREAAADLGMSDVAYAKAKKHLQSEGRIGKYRKLA